ncbi:MAG TPA: glycine zipper 2TM domain-containing protein, partial [Gammaproteobacteria bacterium]|nr:glycine zipper 2TM domain-containing protein [Gammaproteobacteria bacterium]
KSMLMGVVAGVGVATAGGVLGYQFLGKPGAEVAVEEQAPAHAAPATRTAAAPAAPKEECWDEQVAVTAGPKDEHRIAGTAIGAVVGGAVGKDVGDRDITTAVGAAAGALIGRKIQERVQENNADKRTTTTVERRCGPPGSAPR